MKTKYYGHRSKPWDDVEGLINKGFKIVVGFWILGLCLGGTALYVAWHFISKHW